MGYKVIEIIINGKLNLDVFVFVQDPSSIGIVFCFQLFFPFSQVFVVVAARHK